MLICSSRSAIASLLHYCIELLIVGIIGPHLLLDLHTFFDSIATSLRNCRRPKGSLMGYIFFYFEKSVNIHNI